MARENKLYRTIRIFEEDAKKLEKEAGKGEYWYDIISKLVKKVEDGK